LKIKGRCLKAKAIDAAADMCRDVRMVAMRDLMALGLVTMERERVIVSPVAKHERSQTPGRVATVKNPCRSLIVSKLSCPFVNVRYEFLMVFNPDVHHRMISSFLSFLQVGF
jgi:hypothetical protein